VSTYTEPLEVGDYRYHGGASYVAITVNLEADAVQILGADVMTIWKGATMPAAMTATETERTYRFDITAPPDTTQVTLYQDGQRTTRSDKSPPWVFTQTLTIRPTPYIIEAEIEGPFGSITTTLQIPEQPTPAPETRSVHLAWNASRDPAVTGYRMKAGASSGTYVVITDAGHKLDGVLLIPHEWSTAYFCIAAYDAANHETPSAEMEQSWPA
jgi:hypothetical protein